MAPSSIFYNASLLGKYSSRALLQGVTALDSTLRQMFLVVSQPGDEAQPAHQLVVLSLPGGDVMRRRDLEIAAGPIWNVQFDEIGGMLVAASLTGEGLSASARLVSIDTSTGAVTILTLLPSPVVFAISAFDRFSRSYFFLDSATQRPRMYSLASAELSPPFDLAGENSGRLTLALGFETSSGMLFALTCEWPQSDSSPVFLVRFDPFRNTKVSEVMTALRGSHISFATFVFDFVQGECLVSLRDGQMIVYNYLTNHSSVGLVNASIAALSLDVYQDRTPAIELVLPGKTATDASSRVTFVGANFGVKNYEAHVLFDALKCTGVVHTGDGLLSCTVTPLSEIDVDKEFALTTKVLDRQSSKMRALELTESWSQVSPESSLTLQSTLGAQITIHGRGFRADAGTSPGRYRYRLLLTAEEHGLVSAPSVAGSLNTLVFDAPVWLRAAAKCKVRLLHDPQSESFATGNAALFQYVPAAVENVFYELIESWAAIEPTRGYASHQGQITVRGLGFDPHGGAYQCEFDGFDGLVDAEPLSHREIICKLPVWAQSAEGSHNMYLRSNGIRVTRFSKHGSASDPDDSARFLVVQTWDAVTPSRGPVMGGATVTLQGNAFDRTQTYTCTFTDRREKDTTVAAQVIDATAILCTSSAADEKGKGALALVMDGRVTVGVWDFEYVPVVGNVSLPSIARANGGTLVSVYASGVFTANESYACSFTSAHADGAEIFSKNFTAKKL